MRTTAYALVLELTSLENRIDVLSDKLSETNVKEEEDALQISISNLQKKYDKIRDRLENVCL